MNVLVLNCGSSSVKFQVIDTDRERIARDADRRLARGIVERIGGHALITCEAMGREPRRWDAPLRDHRAAVDLFLRWLVSEESGIDGLRSVSEIHAVGHRVVHGGERFQRSILLDDEVVDQIEDCIELAPLHNPANLKGIYAARELLGPGVPQAAVFDTSLHSTMPDTSFLYAIPYSLYVRHRLRRYGFHGTSHRYVAYRYRQITGRSVEDTDIITLHLGNGCSVAAVRGGRSIDTSMGFTPLEGLVMGTRSGDLDPAIILHVMRKEELGPWEVNALLNKHSGLIGVSGVSNDMRALLDAEAGGDERAKLAVDVFCYRLKKYVAAYVGALGGVDGLAFAGGIGENAPVVRERALAGLAALGLELDPERNRPARGRDAEIGAARAGARVFVVPTNEELLIARDTAGIVSAQRRS